MNFRRNQKNSGAAALPGSNSATNGGAKVNKRAAEQQIRDASHDLLYTILNQKDVGVSVDTLTQAKAAFLQAQSQATRSTERVHKLQTQLSEARNTNKQTETSKLSKLEMENAQSRRLVSQLRSQIAELQVSSGSTTPQDASISQHIRRVETLEGKLKEAQQKLLTQQQVFDTQLEIKELECDIAVKARQKAEEALANQGETEQYKQMQQDLSKLQDEHKQLQKEHEDTKEQLRQSRDQVVSLQKNSSSNDSDKKLQDELRTALKRIETLEEEEAEELEEAEKKLAKSEARIQQLTERLQQKGTKESNTCLEGKSDGAPSTSDIEQKLQTQLRTALKRIETLEEEEAEELEEAEKKLAKSEARVQQLMARLQQQATQESTSNNSDLERQLETAQATIALLRSELEMATALNTTKMVSKTADSDDDDSSDDDDEEVEELRRQLSSTRSELAKAQQKVGMMQSRNGGSLDQDLMDRLETEVIDLREKLAVANRALNSDGNASTTGSAAMDAKVKELVQKLTQAAMQKSEQLEETQKILREKVREIAEMKEAMAKMDIPVIPNGSGDDSERGDGRLEETLSRLEDAKERIEELEAELKEAHSRSDDDSLSSSSSSNAAAVKQELVEAQEKLASMQEGHAGEIHGLNEKLQQSEAKVVALSHQVEQLRTQPIAAVPADSGDVSASIVSPTGTTKRMEAQAMLKLSEAMAVLVNKSVGGAAAQGERSTAGGSDTSQAQEELLSARKRVAELEEEARSFSANKRRLEMTETKLRILRSKLAMASSSVRTSEKLTTSVPLAGNKFPSEVEADLILELTETKQKLQVAQQSIALFAQEDTSVLSSVRKKLEATELKVAELKRMLGRTTRLTGEGDTNPMPREEHEIAILRAELAAAEQKNKETQLKLETSELKVSTLKSNLVKSATEVLFTDSCSDSTSTLKKELEENKLKLRIAEERVSSLEDKEAEALLETEQMLQKSEDVLALLTAELALKKSKESFGQSRDVEALFKELENTKTALRRSEERITTIEELASETMTSADNLRAENIDLKETLAELSQKLQEGKNFGSDLDSNASISHTEKVSGLKQTKDAKLAELNEQMKKAKLNRSSETRSEAEGLDLDELANSKKEVAELKTKLEELQKEYDELEEMADAAVNEAQQELEMKDAKIDELSAQIGTSSTKGDATALTADAVEELRNKRIDVEELTLRLEETTGKLERAKETIVKMQNNEGPSVLELEEKLEASEKNCELLEKTNSEIAQRMSELQLKALSGGSATSRPGELDSTMKELEKAKADVKKLQKEYAELEEMADAAMTEAKEELESKSAKIDQLTANMRRMSGSSVTSSGGRSTFRRRSSEFRRMLEHRNYTDDNAERLQEIVASLAGTIQELRKRVSAYEHETSATKPEIGEDAAHLLEDSEAEVQKLTHSLKQLEEMADEALSEAENELKIKDEEISRLKKELGEDTYSAAKSTGDFHRKLVASQKRCEELETCAKEAAAEAQRQLETRDKKIAELLSQMKAGISPSKPPSSTALQQQLIESQLDVEELNLRLEEANMKLERARETIAKMQKGEGPSVLALQEELEAKEKNCELLEKTNSEIARRMSEISSMSSGSVVKTVQDPETDDDMKQELADAKRRICELQKEYDELEEMADAAVNEAQQELEVKDKRILELETSAGQSAETVSGDLQQELKNSRIDVEELTLRLEETTVKLEKAKETIAQLQDNNGPSVLELQEELEAKEKNCELLEKTNSEIARRMSELQMASLSAADIGPDPDAVEDAKAEVAELKTKLEELQKEYDELEEMADAAVNEAQQELEMKDAKIDELSAQIGTSSTKGDATALTADAVEELRNKRIDVEELTLSLEETTGKLERAKETIVKMQNNEGPSVLELEEKLEASEKNCELLEKTNSEIAQRMSELQLKALSGGSATSRPGELDSTMKELEKAKADVKKLQKEYAELEEMADAAMTEAKEELESKSAKIDQLTANMRRMSGSSVTSSGGRSTFRRRSSEFRRILEQKNHADANVERVQEIVAGLAGTIQELRRNITAGEASGSDVDDTSKLLEASKVEVSAVTASLKQLEKMADEALTEAEDEIEDQANEILLLRTLVGDFLTVADNSKPSSNESRDQLNVESASVEELQSSQQEALERVKGLLANREPEEHGIKAFRRRSSEFQRLREHRDVSHSNTRRVQTIVANLANTIQELRKRVVELEQDQAESAAADTGLQAVEQLKQSEAEVSKLNNKLKELELMADEALTEAESELVEKDKEISALKESLENVKESLSVSLEDKPTIANVPRSVDMQELEISLKETLQRLEKAKETIAQLQDNNGPSVLELQEELEAKEKNCELLEKTNSEIARRMSELQMASLSAADIGPDPDALEGAKAEVAELKTKLEELQKEYDELEEMADAAVNEAQQELEMKDKRILELETSAGQSAETISGDLQQELKNSRIDVEELTLRLEETTEKLEKAKETIAQLQDNNGPSVLELQEELEAKEKNCELLEKTNSEIARRMSELQMASLSAADIGPDPDAVEDAKAEVAELKTKLEELQKEYDEFEEMADAAVSEAQQELEAKDREIALLRSQTNPSSVSKEAGALRDELRNCQIDVEELKIRLDETNEKLEKAKDTIAQLQNGGGPSVLELQQELEAKERNCELLEKTNSEIARRMSEMSCLSAAQAVQDPDALEDAQKELTETKKKLVELQKEYDELEEMADAAVTEAQKEIEAKDAKIVDLSTKLQNSHAHGTVSDSSDLATQLKNSRIDVEELTLRLDETTEKLEKAKDTIAQLQNGGGPSVLELQQELEAKERNCELLEKTNSEIARRMSEMSCLSAAQAVQDPDALEDAQKELTETKKKLIELQKEYDELEDMADAAVTEAQKEIEAKDAKIVDLSTKLQNSHAHGTVSDSSDLATQLKNSRIDVEELTLRLDETTEKLEKAKDTIAQLQNGGGPSVLELQQELEAKERNCELLEKTNSEIARRMSEMSCLSAAQAVQDPDALEDAQKELTETKKKLIELQKEYDELEDMADAAVTEAQKEIEAKDAKIVDLSTKLQNSHAHGTVSDSSDLATQLKNSRIDVEELTLRLDETIEKLEKAKDTIAQLQNGGGPSVLELQQELEAKERNCELLEKTNSEIARRMSEMSCLSAAQAVQDPDALEDAQKELTETKKKLIELQKEYDELEDMADAAVTEAQKEIEAKDAKIVDLSTKLQNSHAHGTVSDSSDLATQLKNSRIDVEELTLRLDETTEKLEKAKDTIAQLQNGGGPSVLELQQELEAKERNCELLEKTNSEIARRMSEMSCLSAAQAVQDPDALEDAQKELTETKKKLVESQKEYDELEEMADAAVTEAQKEIETKDAKIVELSSKTVQSSASPDLAEQLKNSRIDIEELSLRLKEANQKLDHATETIAQLQSGEGPSVLELQEQLAASEKNAELLEKTNSEIARRMSDMQLLALSATQVGPDPHVLEDTKKEVATYKAKVDELTKEYEELEQMADAAVTEAQQELESKDAKISELSAKLEKLNQDGASSEDGEAQTISSGVSSKLAASEAEVSELIRAKNAALKALQAAKETIADLEGDAASEMSYVQHQLEMSEASVARLQEIIVNMANSIKELRARVVELEANVGDGTAPSDREDILRELENSKMMIEELRDALDEKEEALVSAQSLQAASSGDPMDAIEELEKSMMAASRLRHSLGEANDKLKKAEQRIEELESEQGGDENNLKESLVLVAEELSSAQERVSSLEAEKDTILTKAQQDLDRKEREMAELRSSLPTAGDQSKRSGEFEAMAVSLGAAKKRIAELENGESEALKDAKEQLDITKSQLIQVAKALHETNQMLEEEREESENKIHAIVGLLQQTKEMLATAQERIAALETENAKQKHVIAQHLR